MLGVVLGYLFGIVHGMRHALEPDHIAALSTLVAEQRSVRSSVRFALAWGVGHGLMLLAVGGVLFSLRRAMPQGLADAFELAVAVMLVALGVRALVAAAALGRVGAPLPHAHRAQVHAHPHVGEHVHLGSWALARRPLVVGLVHGLAGSGALATLAMAELPTIREGLLFMALYGLGATCGMMALAGVAGLPLARLSHMPRIVPALMGATGVLSMVLGVVWGSPIAARLLGGG